jgi:carbamoyl-phosphate synthase large subunit
MTVVQKDEMTIETLSGIKSLKLYFQNGKVNSATVDMGPAVLEPSKIPVNLSGDSVISRPVKIAGKEYNITCVSMGNPHCVVFMDHLDNLDIERIGPLFEYDPLFPERVNTEFITVVNKTTLKMRVWERGSGETWACGTGACAAAVAAVLNGYCPMNEEITVRLKGGNLSIRYTGDTVYMTGNAVKVFEGIVEV